MKKFKFKYIFIILILLIQANFIYQHYIYYKIPYNPLADLAHPDTPTGFYFKENRCRSEETIAKATHNLDTTTRMFEFNISSPSNGAEVHISEIYLDNLTILRIKR